MICLFIGRLATRFSSLKESLFYLLRFDLMRFQMFPFGVLESKWPRCHLIGCRMEQFIYIVVPFTGKTQDSRFGEIFKMQLNKSSKCLEKSFQFISNHVESFSTNLLVLRLNGKFFKFFLLPLKNNKVEIERSMTFNSSIKLYPFHST